MTKQNIIVIYVVVAILVVAMAIYLRRYILPERLNDKIDDMFNFKTDTETKIFNAAKERLGRNFTPAQTTLLAGLMVAQSKQEAGSRYNSRVFKELNNAFGYKVFKGSPYQLFSKSITAVDGGASAQYKNVEDSAREVADWIGRRKVDFAKVKNANDYVDAMFKNGYTPMHYKPDYVKNVNIFFKQTTIA